MSFQVRIDGSDVAFACGAGETVLDAAERAGWLLPYACRRGACATCESGLVAGEVAVGRSGQVCQGPAGAVRLCQARPRSDLVIVPTRYGRGEPPQRRVLAARIRRIERPAPDVVTLKLRFPAGERVRFRAGQYLQVRFGDGEIRNFSMANAPHESDGAQLHIRVVPGGRFSDCYLAGVAEGDMLDVELPYGEFYIRDGDAPIVMLATGTGYAPIKSMLEDLIRQRNQRPVSLYWGARRAVDLYARQGPEKWAARHDWFHFVPVLSDMQGDGGERLGLVHEQVMRDFPDLSGVQVYACGHPAMTAAAREAFVSACGLPAACFFSDAFVASGGSG